MISPEEEEEEEYFLCTVKLGYIGSSFEGCGSVRVPGGRNQHKEKVKNIKTALQRKRGLRNER